MKTFLTCTDFSDTADPVLDQTAALARAMGGRVVLLHVEQPEAEYMGFDVGYVPPTQYVPVDQRAAYGKLQEAATRLEEAGLEVEPIYDEGLVVDSILHQAREKEADLLVLGSHGHGALYHLMMGSITEGVLRHAEHPVLVVPAGKKQHGKKQES